MTHSEKAPSIASIAQSALMRPALWMRASTPIAPLYAWSDSSMLIIMHSSPANLLGGLCARLFSAISTMPFQECSGVIDYSSLSLLVFSNMRVVSIVV